VEGTRLLRIHVISELSEAFLEEWEVCVGERVFVSSHFLETAIRACEFFKMERLLGLQGLRGGPGLPFDPTVLHSHLEVPFGCEQ
jgi:hypothetical protein